MKQSVNCCFACRSWIQTPERQASGLPPPELGHSWRRATSDERATRAEVAGDERASSERGRHLERLEELLDAGGVPGQLLHAALQQDELHKRPAALHQQLLRGAEGGDALRLALPEVGHERDVHKEPTNQKALPPDTRRPVTRANVLASPIQHRPPHASWGLVHMQPKTACRRAGRQELFYE